MEDALKRIPESKSLALVIVLLVSTLVYANTLFNGFVHDDHPQILNNEWIQSFENLPSVLASSAQGSSVREEVTSNYYRPVMQLVYMVNYRISGLEPWGFHLANILFHGANSVMVFLIAVFLFGSTGNKNNQIHRPNAYNLTALFTALFFAAHPINTEPVAWAAGVPELTFTFFCLTAFYFYIRNTKGHGLTSPYYVLSLASFFLSTLSKETSMALIIFIVAYDLLIKRDISIRSRVSVWVKRYLPYAVVAALYFLIRVNALKGFAPREPMHPELDQLHYIINIFPLLGKYFLKLVLPVDLNAYHTLRPVLTVTDPVFIVSALVAFASASAVWFLRRSAPLASFFILWLIVPLLPVLYIPMVGDNTFAERYVYLPSIGFSFLLAMTIFKFGGRVFKTTLPLVVLSLIITSLYGAGTVTRNRVWQSDLTLWTDTVKKSPDSGRARHGLGYALFEQGRTLEAIAELKKAMSIKLYETQPDGHYDLALAYQTAGVLGQAIYHYREAMRYGFAGDADTHNNLGNALARSGRFEEAVQEYRLALRIDPDNSTAIKNLSIVMKRLQGIGYGQ